MSNLTTLARPYAKALFELALSEKRLDQWSEYLNVLAQVILDPEVSSFIRNPASTAEQQVILLNTLNEAAFKSDKSLNNLIKLLVENKRSMLLPEIAALYEFYKAEQEKTLDVDVISFSELSQQQEQKLIESLSARLQRNVSLNISLDPSLIGGAILRAGDLVIDGSVRSKLLKLQAELAA